MSRVFPGRSLLEPLAGITLPVTGWITAGHDPWLRAPVHARLAQAGSWQHSVAVGLFTRLAVPERAADLATAREDLARPRQWARRPAPAQVPDP